MCGFKAIIFLPCDYSQWDTYKKKENNFCARTVYFGADAVRTFLIRERALSQLSLSDTQIDLRIEMNIDVKPPVTGDKRCTSPAEAQEQPEAKIRRIEQSFAKPVTSPGESTSNPGTPRCSTSKGQAQRRFTYHDADAVPLFAEHRGGTSFHRYPSREQVKQVQDECFNVMEAQFERDLEEAEREMAEEEKAAAKIPKQLADVPGCSGLGGRKL
ncbi:hypothetical protein QR680_000238 [Steinernema hermaphroditum]|uniref:Uncharacterized protein n=1 Tax=Steinernema hermaphroditum TaxID=289476 RepID=A0AA39GUP9_9BILA|nr:hypothetical protein QR680_000238 [Steinernema hermaphroditum]